MNPQSLNQQVNWQDERAESFAKTVLIATERYWNLPLFILEQSSEKRESSQAVRSCKLAFWHCVAKFGSRQWFI
jgi:hypothetical protein